MICQQLMWLRGPAQAVGYALPQPAKPRQLRGRQPQQNGPLRRQRPIRGNAGSWEAAPGSGAGSRPECAGQQSVGRKTRELNCPDTGAAAE